MADGGASSELRLSDALILGALHGPAELLPISSSGHVTIIPWLLGSEYADLDPDVRKAFEVALHAGTALGLLISLRGEIAGTIRTANPRLAMLIAVSFAPPAAIGYGLEGPIERNLGTPATIALGLIGGAIAMAIADRSPQTRGQGEATVVDALWLGIAQASALMPGVSRNGATLAAARWRGFNREESNRLSRHVALPIIAGATILKSARLRRRGLPPRTRIAFLAGAGASLVSTLGSTWLISQVERDRSLLPYAAYRVALGTFVLRRIARTSRSGGAT